MRPCFLGCALFAACLFAPWTAVAVPKDWLSSAIAPQARTHDFGTVARAAKTEHRFHITNHSASDLFIRGVRASCGCTTPIVETKKIPPGQTGSILARFNTGTFTGQKQATLTVSLDGAIRTELQLNVRGYIRSDVVLNPGEVRFGQVPEGEAKVIKIQVDYAGRSDWAIEKIVSPFDYIQAQFEEVSRGQGRVQYQISASITKGAPAGFLRNQLVLHTNDRRLTTLPIRLSAQVQSAIQFSPQSFALGRVKPGEPVPQRLVVKGKKPFRILDITSEAAEVRFDPIKDAKPAHLINIVLAPNSQGLGGPVNSHVMLTTDLDDQPLKLGLSYEIVTQSRPPDTVQASN